MFKRLSRWWRRPKNCAGHVYYAKLRANGETYYKLGFTTKLTLAERFAYAGHGDEKLIERVLMFGFDEKAWDLEQSLLEHFRKHRAFGRFSKDPAQPLAGRGQTELFRSDILGLDEDLYYISPRQLEELKEEQDAAAGGCFLILIAIVLAPFTLGWSLVALFFGGGLIFEKRKPTTVVPKRPTHPPGIQVIIETLQQSTALSSSQIARRC